MLLLECSFNGSPGGIWVIGRNNDRYLVAHINAEVRHASKQNAVFATICFNIVSAVVLGKRTNNLGALNRSNLLVNEAAVIGDGEFENIALNEL